MQLYLVCDDCGEAFDCLETGYSHMHDIMIEARFFVRTEEEAM
jgi:hypothetical protein